MSMKSWKKNLELTKIILLDHCVLSEGQNVFEALNAGFPSGAAVEQFLIVPGRPTLKAHGWKNSPEQLTQGSFVKFHVFVISLISIVFLKCLSCLE